MVDAGVTVSDVDDPTLDKATVTITNLLDGSAELLAATASGGISAGDISYAAGVLTIDPAADQPLAAFQAVLRSVTYNNLDDTPTTTIRTVTFTVNDGALDSNTAAKAVLVTATNDAPVIISNGGGPTAAVSAAENQTAVTDVQAFDPEGETENGGGLVYSKTGGADSAKFVLNTATGVLTFMTAPNFEAPTDANEDNKYEVRVTVTDGGGLKDFQDITVTVTNVADEVPVFASASAASVPEGTTTVVTVAASDPDGLGTVSYSKTGGPDAAKFDLTGDVLTFVSAPDFENPADAGTNNVYLVQVTANDGAQSDGPDDHGDGDEHRRRGLRCSSSAALASVAEGTTAVGDGGGRDPDRLGP